MSTGLIWHNDLDGLYSAKLIIESGYGISDAYAVDYGKDHSHIINECDNFISVDFAENIAGEKTELFVDHHIRSERANGAQKEVIQKSPSCTNLLVEKDLVDSDLLSNKALACINAVDSAAFLAMYNKNFTAIDILFPDVNNEMGQYILMNDLLRKNRKTNLSLVLLAEDTFDIETLLYKTDRVNGVLKQKKYLEAKMKFFEKLSQNTKEYIKNFSGIPALFTRKFTPWDWKGYDNNIFNFICKENMYTMVIFEMNDNVNVQLQKNPFCIASNSKAKNKSLYSIIKKLIDEPRGHENILLFTFKDINEAISELDNIITTVSENI